MMRRQKRTKQRIKKETAHCEDESIAKIPLHISRGSTKFENIR